MLRLFIILLFFILSSIQAEEKFYFDFIYVNANSGQSSGGHSAIRLGELVYHFQYYSDEIFHLVREDWKFFIHSYGNIENRSIKIRRVPVTKEGFVNLKRAWDQLVLIQEKELRILKELNNNYIILNSIQNKIPVKIKTLGYFENNLTNSPSAILEFFENKKGKLFLYQLLEEKNQRLQNYNLSDEKIFFPDTKLEFPDHIKEFSSEIIDLIVFNYSIESILYGRKLKEDSIINTELKLNEEAIIKFKLYSKEILEKIFDILISERPEENSFALSVYISRFLAVEKSIQEKTLFLLNSFPTDIPHFYADKKMKDTGFIKIFSNTEIRIKELSNKTLSENNYNESNMLFLEDGYSKFHALKNSVNLSVPFPLLFQQIFPSKDKEIYLDLKIENIVSKQVKSKNIYTKYNDYLKSKYSFDLIRKNCTTEIFRFLEKKVGKDDSKTILGGFIDHSSELNFIPFAAYKSTEKVYRAGQSIYFPSYRLRDIQHKNNLDFMPLNSKYSYIEEDGWFLFFTDNRILLRPVYGFFNLGAGLTEFIYGLITYPVQGKSRVVSGFYSILFSFPELFFFNIRKGSFPYAEETFPEPEILESESL